MEIEIAGLLAGATIARIGGADRFGIVEQLSQYAFSSGADTAYIVTGRDFPGAVVAGWRAGRAGVLLLIVAPDGVPIATSRELQRLYPKRIVIIGGSGAVSDATADQLQSYVP